MSVVRIDECGDIYIQGAGPTFQWAGKVDAICRSRSNRAKRPRAGCILRSWASQPLEPAEWLALLILKAGDVESNPGPQNRKLPPSALTTQTTTLNSTKHSHATTSHPNQKLLTLLQLNINSITNKHEELKLLVTELQPDIITIQETKLKKHNKTPQIQHTQQFALTEQTAKEEDSSLTLNTT